MTENSHHQYPTLACRCTVLEIK